MDDVEKKIEDTDDLSERMIDMLNASDLDTNSRVIAVLDVLLSVLASIKCPDCRKMTTKALRKQLIPALIHSALSAPSEHTHVH